MINFNQFVAKRLLAGYVSIALDELDAGAILPPARMKRFLGNRYAAYQDEAEKDNSVSVSAYALEWDAKRAKLLRSINLALVSRQISHDRPRDEKEWQRRRKFNVAAEELLESYRESIEGTTDEAGFINYEASYQAPADEPYGEALDVIDEFRLPRLKKRGEFGEDAYKREIQRQYLQDILDELEGRAKRVEMADASRFRDRMERLRKYSN